MDDFLTALAGYGISGSISSTGVMTVNGTYDGWITNTTGGIQNLGINSAWTSSTATTITGKTSPSSQRQRTITTTMDMTTTFADLGLAAGTATVQYGGKSHVISMASTSTMDDFLTALAGYGISGSISSTGVMTLQGTYDGWITNTTGGIQNLGINSAWSSSTTTTITGKTSVSTQLTCKTNPIMDKSIKMVNLQDSSGNSLGITTGSYYIYEDGVRTTHEITEDTTVNDFMAEIANYGLIADTAQDGAIAVSGHKASYMATSALGSGRNSNVVDILFSTWNFNNVYNSNNLDIPTPIVESITRDTKLSNIAEASETRDGEFKEGLITILRNGVQTHLYVNSSDTVGTFLDELSMYGFESVINDKGQIIIKNTGDSKLQAYYNSSQASNILDIIGSNEADWIVTKSYNSAVQNVITYEDVYKNANESTKLSDVARITNLDTNNQTATTDALLSSLTGKLEVLVDGETNYITVNKDETIGALLEKFRAMGLEADISGGKITIHSGYKDMAISTPSDGSKIVANGILSFNQDIGGYVSSSEKIISTTYEDRSISAADWANGNTKLSAMNISSGTLSIYRNGERAKINVSSNDTFNDLLNKIHAKLADVQMSFEDGYLVLSSEQGQVTAGASNDTSNFASITGIKTNDEGKVVSTRELYTVDHDAVVTKAGLFRNGTVTQGTFIVGDQEITIGANTTIDEIITAINSSETSRARAYWDSFEGKLVIQSRNTGNMYVNIEAGTSNFTDVLGFTSAVTDSNGTYSALNTGAQTIGSNAKIHIDGATYTANTNTIGSDVTRIAGLTLNLKEVTEGEEVVLKVERDKEALADVVEDVVTAYNDLMTGVDEAIATGGDLADQTTLKMIRNQLRSYMTSAMSGLSVYRNMDAIGISVNQAVGSNISTKTSDIVTLNFDRDKFYEKYADNPYAMKSLLVGDWNMVNGNLTLTNGGVLSKIEELIESSLAGVSGYFDTQNASYNNQISTLNKQIAKANQEVARYREMLENKFSSMDMLIAQMQEQYQSFLKS